MVNLSQLVVLVSHAIITLACNETLCIISLICAEKSTVLILLASLVKFLVSLFVLVINMTVLYIREIPRSESKAEDGEKREKEERTMVITIAKLRMAHAWRKQAAWAKILYKS